ncbi:hypothetical protein [Streptomyces sp900116325]
MRATPITACGAIQWFVAPTPPTPTVPGPASAVTPVARRFSGYVVLQ